MRAGYALPTDNASIGEARRRARVFLDQARPDRPLPVSDRVEDLTQLVVSELVTNVLKYAPGPVLVFGTAALCCLRLFRSRVRGQGGPCPTTPGLLLQPLPAIGRGCFWR